MNRIGFSPSFSPQIETLANHLPRSLIIQDGRVWIFSYDTYIKDIASGVGRDWKEAPTGSDIFQRFEKKYHKDIQNLRHQADVLIREIDAFLSLLGEYLRSGNAWNVTELTPSQKRISIRSEAQLILIKRPYPLPRPPKRPRKRLFRRIKRKEIGPEDI
ncbi:MAG: hypothetical protein QCI82_02630 [Candidatus Thermoplasmatota archaeon]|nr:hypothetical protein [Candidatus Thermoplasmatota archaeon]